MSELTSRARSLDFIFIFNTKYHRTCRDLVRGYRAKSTIQNYFFETPTQIRPITTVLYQYDLSRNICVNIGPSWEVLTLVAKNSVQSCTLHIMYTAMPVWCWQTSLTAECAWPWLYRNVLLIDSKFLSSYQHHDHHHHHHSVCCTVPSLSLSLFVTPFGCRGRCGYVVVVVVVLTIIISCSIHLRYVCGSWSWWSAKSKPCCYCCCQYNNCGRDHRLYRGTVAIQ